MAQRGVGVTDVAQDLGAGGGGVVTHLHTTALTTNLGAYTTTPTFAPAVGDLLIVFVAVTGSVSAEPSLTEDAGGGTYTLLGEVANATAGDALYCYVRDTRCETADARTLTWTSRPTDAATSFICSVAKVTGMSRAGLSAIRQRAVTDLGAAGGTPNTVFAAAPLTANPCIGAVHHLDDPPTIVPPASFTERNDSAVGTPNSELEYASRDSGHTSATITWGAAAGVGWSAFSVELDTTLATDPAVANYRTRERSVGGATVVEQYVIGVRNRVPSFRGMAASWRNLTDNTPGHSFENKTGSTVLVALLAIILENSADVASTTIRPLYLHKLSGAASGGALLTKVSAGTGVDAAETSSASVEIRCDSASDGGVSAALVAALGARIDQFGFTRAQSTAEERGSYPATAMWGDWEDPSGDGFNLLDTPIILRAAEGVVVDQESLSGSYGVIVNWLWEEYTLP